MLKKALNSKFLTYFIAAVTLSGGLFHLYTGGIGTFSSMTQTGVHWLIIFSVAFLIYPKKRERNIFDWILTIITVVVGIWILATWKSRVNRVSPLLSNLEMIISILVVVLVLEAARRCTGNFLTITALVFIVYAKVGPYLPGILKHKGYSWHRILSVLSLSEAGIFGNALSISSTFVVLFVLFGSILNECNGGKLFIDIAYSLTGSRRGGPAKTAILSSLMMGCISGSPVANVVTTGTFTIPLMKKAGYDADEACAVEAVASTGGQIMPPVMGAAAFLVAEYIGIKYGELCVSAFVPAIFYYIALFFIIDGLSVKKGLVGLPKDQLPPLKQALVSGAHLFIPIIALIVCLILGYSSMKSVFWSSVALVIVAETRKSTRISLFGVGKAISNGIKSAVPVAVSCAAAGIIVGIVNLTGLGVKFSSSLISLSHGSIPVALVLTMFASIILGCGLPTTAVYIILASLAAPALVQMGVAPLSAHLFVFYFGCISTITPPVALTAYAAAGIGEASTGKTGLKAFMFGLVAYIVPYMFVFSPALLLKGSVGEIIFAILTALIGIYELSAGVSGYLFGNLNPMMRIILILGGGCLIMFGVVTDIIGIGVMVMMILFQLFVTKKKAKTEGTGITESIVEQEKNE